ncbi:MAG TPA: DUF1653 domain-containing protein [Candidatus Nanoarchaeia archaeon]|nr:DUF1653 domain-containing protein [Candidatus Nanoarchaeia archaeon]
MNRKSDAELEVLLADASQEIRVNGRYVHFRNGNAYIVEKLVIDERTDGVAVVYHRDGKPNIPYVRPAASWLETKLFGTERVPRFRLVE